MPLTHSLQRVYSPRNVALAKSYDSAQRQHERQHQQLPHAFIEVYWERSGSVMSSSRMRLITAPQNADTNANANIYSLSLAKCIVHATSLTNFL
jgi:hypothetical protein